MLSAMVSLNRIEKIMKRSSIYTCKALYCYDVYFIQTPPVLLLIVSFAFQL